MTSFASTGAIFRFFAGRCSGWGSRRTSAAGAELAGESAEAVACGTAGNAAGGTTDAAGSETFALELPAADGGGIDPEPLATGGGFAFKLFAVGWLAFELLATA